MEVNVVRRYVDINHNYNKSFHKMFPFLINITIYNENYYEISFVIKNLLEQVNWNSLRSDKSPQI